LAEYQSITATLGILREYAREL